MVVAVVLLESFSVELLESLVVLAVVLMESVEVLAVSLLVWCAWLDVVLLEAYVVLAVKLMGSLWYSPRRGLWVIVRMSVLPIYS